MKEVRRDGAELAKDGHEWELKNSSKVRSVNSIENPIKDEEEEEMTDFYDLGLRPRGGLLSNSMINGNLIALR